MIRAVKRLAVRLTSTTLARKSWKLLPSSVVTVKAKSKMKSPGDSGSFDKEFAKSISINDWAATPLLTPSGGLPKAVSSAVAVVVPKVMFCRTPEVSRPLALSIVRRTFE